MSDVIGHVVKFKGHQITAECMVKRFVTLVLVHDQDTNSRQLKGSQHQADEYMDYIEVFDPHVDYLIH